MTDNHATYMAESRIHGHAFAKCAESGKLDDSDFFGPLICRQTNKRCIQGNCPEVLKQRKEKSK